MPRLALASPLLLAACAAAQVPVHGVTPGHKCQLAAIERFVGHAATAELGEAIMRTMDYREDRVTVRLGPDHKVTAINCG